MEILAWRLELHQRNDGESPVEDFIETLPTGSARVKAHLATLQEVGNRRPRRARNH
jgi:hypothetical protein